MPRRPPRAPFPPAQPMRMGRAVAIVQPGTPAARRVVPEVGCPSGPMDGVSEAGVGVRLGCRHLGPWALVGCPWQPLVGNLTQAEGSGWGPRGGRAASAHPLGGSQALRPGGSCSASLPAGPLWSPQLVPHQPLCSGPSPTRRALLSSRAPTAQILRILSRVQRSRFKMGPNFQWTTALACSEATAESLKEGSRSG